MLPAVLATLHRAPSPRSDEATVVPSHGHGRIMPPFQVGAPSANPGGRPRGYSEARRALQSWASLDGVRRLIALAQSPDDRVASIVTLEIFDRAYGKPKDFDPSEERPPVRVDVSKLSLAKRKEMLAMIRQTVTVEPRPGQPREALDAPQEPATIDAQAEPPPALDAPPAASEAPARGKPELHLS